jgi:hypothetical protein
VLLYLQSTKNDNAASSVLSALARSTRFAIQPYLIRHGEWWRLFTGAIACGSLPTIGLTAAAVFWIGRLVARRVTHLELLMLAVASLGGGTLLTAMVNPDSFSYSGLALAGGMVAAYLVGRKRGVLGVLSLPGAGQGWMVYGFFFIGWTILGALGSETGGPYAFAGGALAVAPLAWKMFDPFPTNERSKVPALTSALVSALLFAVAAIASGSATNAPTPPRSPFDVISDAGAAGAQTTSASPGWMKVAYWEDNTDVGDFQTYELQCSPEPLVRNDRYEIGVSRTSCDWLKANSSELTVQDAVDSPSCNASLIWRMTIVGTLTSDAGVRPVDAQFEGGANCGSDASVSAASAFGLA